MSLIFTSVAFITVHFFFIVDQDSVASIILQFVYLFINDRHLVCFQLRAIMNKAVIAHSYTLHFCGHVFLFLVNI